jgi:hypothetical protein
MLTWLPTWWPVDDPNEKMPPSTRCVMKTGSMWILRGVGERPYGGAPSAGPGSQQGAVGGIQSRGHSMDRRLVQENGIRNVLHCQPTL